MRSTNPIFVLACALAVCAWGDVYEASPWVGTDNTKEISCGNLYPAIARPWGMNAWTPQTGPSGQGWLYDWKDRKILGLHQTHQPSPWIGDYGQFGLMPTTGKAVFLEKDRACWFSHKSEEAFPHYYRVYLSDYDVTVELTPTERAAALRMTYPATETPRFVIDALDRGSSISVDRAARRVVGYSTKANIRGNEKTMPRAVMTNWFAVVFDKPIVQVQTWDGKKLVDAVSCTAPHTGAVVTFAPTAAGERVQARVASSFIGPEQALRNLEELGTCDFDTLVAQGRDAWNEAMGRFQVDGGTVDERRMFYTCLYRALLFPRQLHEYGADGRPIHRSPYGKGVRPGRYYCDTGFWDTFRALFPLLTFVYPERTAEIMEGLVSCYEESGWLPEWSAPCHRNCMIGQNSASVIADAYRAGCMSDSTARKLYEGLVKATSATNPLCISVGRVGYEEYNTLGYVARDGVTGGKQSAARTLEYAYDDWCIADMGRALGRPASETAVFAKRAENWRNLFHPVHKLMCGRAKDGSFDPDFNSIRWGYDFTEGTPLHYTWSVFHDIPGLRTAMGGSAAFEKQLDDVFAMPPAFDGSYFGGCTHEIREMAIAGFGQYAHGNQPIQHMIYLYDWTDSPQKAQTWARAAMRRLYKPRPDGYCGDEDNGQTSAWFVWSACGLYPVCPASGEYALGAPLFDRVTIRLPQNRTLAVSAPGTSRGKTFAAWSWNDAALVRPFVKRERLLQGGRLEWR